jgi:Leucine-rich repeat (LRR) protein
MYRTGFFSSLLVIVCLCGCSSKPDKSPPVANKNVGKKLTVAQSTEPEVAAERAPVSPATNGPTDAGPTEAETEAIAESLKPLGVSLHFYRHLSGRIELEEGALQEDGAFKPEALALLQKLIAPKTEISFANGSNPLTDKTLQQLALLPYLSSVNLTKLELVTDTGISELAKLRKVEILYLSGEYIKPAITNESLAKLAQIPALETLVISIPTDGAFLTAFAEHPKLRELNIGNKGLTDAGLTNVTAFPHLEVLDLSGASITGEGLAFLKNCPQLTSFVMMNNEKFTDQGAANLASLPKLDVLEITSGLSLLLTDAALKSFGTLPELESLRLSQCPQFTDAGIAELAGLSQLTQLDLEGCTQVTDACLAHIGKIKTLERLYLEDCTKLTNAGIAQLQTLQSLKILELKKSKVTVERLNELKKEIATLERVEADPLKEIPADLQATIDAIEAAGGRVDRGFDELKTVKKVSFNDREITDDILIQVAKLKDLETLWIQYTSIKGSGLKHLAGNSKLKELVLRFNDGQTDNLDGLAELTGLKSLGCNAFTNESLANIAQLTNLTELDLDDGQFNDEGLIHLAGLKNLQSLKFVDTNIKGSGLSHIAALDQLTSLTIYFRQREAGLDDAGVELVGRLKKLEFLHLHGKLVTDAGLAKLSALTQLKNLTLSNTSCTGAGFATWQNVPLEALHLPESPLNDTGLANLKAFPQLKELQIYGSKVTGTGFQELAELKLRMVNLGGCPLTPAGLACLKTCCAPEVSLYVNDSEITDAGLAAVSQISQITSIYAYRTGITDAGLKHLETMKGLSSLSITNTKVTPAGVKALQTALPECRIDANAKETQPAPAPAEEPLRTWTSVDGKSKIEARQTGQTKEAVELKTADGREIKVPRAKLSEADQEYLNKRD